MSAGVIENAGSIAVTGHCFGFKPHTPSRLHKRPESIFSSHGSHMKPELATWLKLVHVAYF